MVKGNEVEMPGGSLLEGKYLDKKGAARALHMSEQTLDRRHREGTGPAGRLRIAGRVFYRIDALEEWLRAQEEPSPAAPLCTRVHNGARRRQMRVR